MDSVPSQPLPHPEPPPQLEGWLISSDAERGEFSLRRVPGWRNSQYRQASTRLLIAILFFAVAVATHRSGLGVPNPGLVLPIAPQWLPAVAVILSIVFTVQAAIAILRARHAPTQIRVLPGVYPLLQGRRDDSIPWEALAAEAQAIVVSERWGRRGKKAEVSWGTLHIWPTTGGLRDLLTVGKQQHDPAGETDLQRAGQQLAQALALPYHYLTKPASVAESRKAPSEPGLCIPPHPTPPKTEPTT